ncbi:crAss001_48 related protein [Acidovorax radicis]|uniref:crAss001_48 related protein n=1 Tax=Acidovorax radicis TaxID=758826 RepID=UPI001CFA84DB|nr:hypothetical protein [Acidovorax radicis]UCV01152.1 hypothetical protein KI609_10765 [Acidovorax radicis]
MTSTVIKPTVGRKVWFRPNGTTDLQKPGTTERGRLNELHGQPLDATVTYVWSERMVNLSVLDHYGNPFIATSVNLLQPGDSTPATGFYAEWMPYQQGQAAKAESASAAMASGIVIPPIGAPSVGTTSASLQLPVIDPGPDSLEREIQAKALPPHQQRVLDEKRELDERLSKLDAFVLDNPLFLKLPSAEQERLSRQSKAMAVYSGILDERIACF